MWTLDRVKNVEDNNTETLQTNALKSVWRRKYMETFPTALPAAKSLSHLPTTNERGLPAWKVQSTLCRVAALKTGENLRRCRNNLIYSTPSMETFQGCVAGT